MVIYRNIVSEELSRELFSHFIRRQEIVKCWRREGGEWVIRDAPFIDDWSEEDYAFLEELSRELFSHFIRRQEIVKCWRREGGEWVIRDAPFIDDWSEEDYAFLVTCLKNTVQTGGFVYGAFLDGELKGFVSAEPGLFGGEHKYIDLSSIHVSEDMRGSGIGRTLFEAAKIWAKDQGAGKLYISAHSAVESQGFYKKMGCREAELYHQGHVEAEPYDCQLECPV